MIPKQIEELTEDIWKSVECREGHDHGRLEILLAMLPGGVYAEDAENRSRARHAVVSALSVAGFRSKDEEHLQALSLWWPKPDKDLPDVLDPARSSCGPDSDSAECRVPFEWFERRLFSHTYSTEIRKVLLIWLPDTMFADEKVTRRFGLIAKALRERHGSATAREDRVRVNILGPQGTSLLREMLPWQDDDPDVSSTCASETVKRQLANAKTTNMTLEGVRMYSWSATTMDALLAPELAGEPSRAEIAKHLKTCWGVDFKNVIAPDDLLVRELIDELKLRRIDLTDQRQQVALISEWDTFYGRSIPVAFKVALEGFKEGGNFAPAKVTTRVSNYREAARRRGSRQSAESFGENVHTFSYLRGIDGKLPGDKTENKEQERPRASSDIEQLIRINDRDMNRAEGQNQLDYIPRLGGELEKLRVDLRRKGSDLKAIGVLGSDFYDKVLILQALRDRFPDVVFFTTDLDARLLQPEFLKFTRNLVVASAFGLTLEPSLQAEIPPFRNSYQTALFFAALDALGYKPEATSRAPFARRFEIGRFNAIDLSVVPKDPAHPLVYRRGPNPWMIVIGLGVLFPAAVILLLRMFPRLRAWGTAAGRWQLLQEAVRIRPEEVRPPFDPRPEDATTVAQLEAYAKSSLRELKSSSRKYAESVLSFLDAELRKIEEASAKVASKFCPSWVGKRNSAEAVEARAKVAARESLDTKFPNLIEPSSERVSVLLSEMKFMRIGTGVALLLVAAFVASVIFSHTSLEGEPFAVWEGTSIWPGEFLRLAAGLIAASFIVRLLHDLEINRLDICEEMNLPSRPLEEGRKPGMSGLYQWVSKHMIHNWHPQWTAGFYDGGKLWEEYQDRERPRLRFLRPFPVVFAYLIFGLALLVTCSSPNSFADIASSRWLPFVPLRGTVAYVADMVVLSISVIPFLLLTFMTVDAIRLCRMLVIHLIQPTHWPAGTKQRFALQNLGADWECLDSWIDIQLIARRTAAVSRLVYYPFIVLSLLIVARSRYFDAWDWPPALVIILLLNAMWAFSASLLLRKTAREAKTATLEALEERRNEVHSRTGTGGEAGDKTDIEARSKLELEQIDRMIDHVKNVKEGAFSSISDDPAIRALLLPFTGGGIALLLEFLTSR